MRFVLVAFVTACWLTIPTSRATASETQRPVRPQPGIANRTEQTPPGDAPARHPQLAGFLHVSEQTLHMLLHREVKQNQPVRESILKMTTEGVARAECNIGVDVVSNSRAANVRLTMNGRAIMNDAVSTMRKIEIHSSSHTEITGFKDVFFYPQGLRVAPSRASCSSAIAVHEIAARRRFVERLAWRRVNKMQLEAEQIASERAAERAEQQLEAEANEPLSELHQAYVENVYQPLTERGIFPDMHLASTGEHVIVRIFQDSQVLGTKAQQAQNSAPPAPANDVAVMVRDTLINELAGEALRGKTITDMTFANVMQTFTGKTPRPLWVHERTDRWSVTMATERPVSVRFADEVVSITFRIDKVNRGEQQFERLVEVSAQFELEKTVDGPRLIRLGDVAVEFTDSGISSGPRETEFREFLQRKFNGIFLSDLYFDGLIPPAGGSWAKFRRLELAQLSSNNGWFAIGYALQAESSAQ